MLSIFPSSPVSAEISDQNDVEIRLDKNTNITITIPKEYESMLSEQDLLDIALDEGLEDGQHINIHQVETVNQTEITPRWVVINSYPTTLTPVGSEWTAQNYFLISVAKGQTTTLEENYSKTLGTEIIGSYYSLTGELNARVTASYTTTYEFKGPPESSYYNSREYRVRFYAQTYNFTQHHYMSGMYIGTKTGTIKKPTRWLSYSIDHKLP